MTKMNIKKYTLLALFLGLVGIALSHFATGSHIFLVEATQQPLKPTQRQINYDHTIMVITQDHRRVIFKGAIASTPDELASGLSFVDKIEDDQAMLFSFDPAKVVSMWMKDTIIPLDMLFIAENGRIVKIQKNVTPLSIEKISSDVPVMGVLEIKGGGADKNYLKAGDLVLNARLF